MKKAFSILELIVAMTITGIIMGSTLQLLTNIYKSYRYARDINELDQEVSNVSVQIVKYLENRVEGSEIHQFGDKNFSVLSSFTFFQSGNLQWISREFDGYTGVWNSNNNIVAPVYSGVLDLSVQNNKAVLFLDNTNESNLSALQEIIYANSNDKLDISNCKTKGNCSALLFKWRSANDFNGFGWRCGINKEATNAQTCLENNMSISVFVGEFNITNSKVVLNSILNDFKTGHLDGKFYEQYVISDTAIGLKLENQDLYLYKNYRPWNGDDISQGDKNLLLKNVTDFSYKSNSGLIEFKLCASNGLTNNDEIIFCRENLVY